jgi:hypothetical protein
MERRRGQNIEKSAESMRRFDARLRLIRTNIVGPPDPTMLSASIAGRHSVASCSVFESFKM